MSDTPTTIDRVSALREARSLVGSIARGCALYDEGYDLGAFLTARCDRLAAIAVSLGISCESDYIDSATVGPILAEIERVAS